MNAPQISSKQQKRQLPSLRFASQKGMGFLNALVVLLLVAAVGGFLIKVIPVYIENYSIKQVVHNVQNDLNNPGVTPDGVKQMIVNGAIMNNLNNIKPENIVVRRDGSKLIVKLNYTVQEHLMYNVALLLSFDDEIELNAR